MVFEVCGPETPFRGPVWGEGLAESRNLLNLETCIVEKDHGHQYVIIFDLLDPNLCLNVDGLKEDLVQHLFIMDKLFLFVFYLFP